MTTIIQASAQGGYCYYLISVERRAFLRTCEEQSHDHDHNGFMIHVMLPRRKSNGLTISDVMDIGRCEG